MASYRGTALLLLASLAALALAQQPTLVRLRGAVGDTVDLAERDSFHLFPNTAGFRNAVILALPGPEFFAEIERAGADSTRHILLRIMPTDLERIRFLIDNHESVAAQQRSDTAYARALASFWQMIEEHPLRNMAGEPAIAEKVSPAPPESLPSAQPGTVQTVPPTRPESVPSGQPATAQVVGPAPTESMPPGQPGTAQTARAVPPESMPSGQPGTTQVVGLAPTESMPSSQPGTAQAVRPARPEVVTTGKPLLPPVTSENRYNYILHGATLGSIAGGLLGAWTGIGGAASIVLTAAGSYAGYKYGDGLDRVAVAKPPLRGEGSVWRSCCAIGGGATGLYVGVATAALVYLVAEHRPLAWVPVVLSGVGVTLEIATLSYHLGRAIDRVSAVARGEVPGSRPSALALDYSAANDSHPGRVATEAIRDVPLAGHVGRDDVRSLAAGVDSVHRAQAQAQAQTVMKVIVTR